MLYKRAIAYIIDLALIAILAHIGADFFNKNYDANIHPVKPPFTIRPEVHVRDMLCMSQPFNNQSQKKVGSSGFFDCMNGDIEHTVWFKILVFIVYVFYATLFVALFRGTIGNYLTGIRVVRIECGVIQNPGCLRAFLRAVGVLVMGFNVFLLLFWDMSVRFNGSRGIIDVISGTAIMDNNMRV